MASPCCDYSWPPLELQCQLPGTSWVMVQHRWPTHSTQSPGLFPPYHSNVTPTYFQDLQSHPGHHSLLESVVTTSTILGHTHCLPLCNACPWHSLVTHDLSPLWSESFWASTNSALVLTECPTSSSFSLFFLFLPPQAFVVGVSLCDPGCL